MKIKNIFRPDYDTSLVTKWTREAVGSSYRQHNTVFNWFLYGYLVIFVVIALAYTSAYDEDSQGISPNSIFYDPSVSWWAMIFVGGGSIIVMCYWFLVTRYGKNSRAVASAYWKRESEYSLQQMKQLISPLSLEKPVHSLTWSKLRPNKKKELIIHAFNTFKGEQEESVTNEFLEIISHHDISYARLPLWVVERIILRDWLYYWYEEKKERYDEYIKLLELE